MRLSAIIIVLLAAPVWAETPKPTITKSDEPIAKRFSAAKAAEYIDGVSLAWTRERKCFSCHTNVTAMIARPMVAGGDEAPMKEMRAFLENQAAGWDKTPPKTDFHVLTAAFSLAGNDAATTGKLHPLTKKALDFSTKLQKEDGSWKWPKCDWPPLEHDDYFGVVFMAIAYGIAPGDYAKSDEPKPTLEKLRTCLKSNPPPDLHHKASLLWASQKISGLMSEEEQKAAIKEAALQTTRRRRLVLAGARQVRKEA
jgi:squalene-hopene/tetraprenyl-beta-curcumene cyclase